MRPRGLALQFVGREKECIEIWLRQVVSSSDVSLWLRCWESRKLLDGILLPSPREDGSQVFTRLVGRATGIGTTVLNCFVVNPPVPFDLRPFDLANALQRVSFAREASD